MTGQFFAVGPEQWTEACNLGLNPAVAFLVLARGTGGDNVTTRWSADAVARCTGMSWRRAAESVAALESAKLASNVTVPGKRPMRKLVCTRELAKALWLPNELVTGAGKESPPIARLRQAQNLEHLQAFIELYGLQDLAGDGGLPRNLVYAPFAREHICDAGQFRVYGFTRSDTRYCYNTGPLVRFHKQKRKDGEQAPAWVFLYALERMGLLETADYLAEGKDANAELIHPLTGDADAEGVHTAAAIVAANLPGGYKQEAARFDYALPVIRDIPEPAIVGVSRLTYRPHTKLTAAWYARHRASCERFERIYGAIACGDFQHALAA